MAYRTLSIIVPAFNEALNLAGAVHESIASAEAVGLDDWQIIVVDDGSTDDTAVVAERLARQIPCVETVRHERNLGFAAAYRTGLALARMEHVTFVPGDNEVAPDSLRDIFAAIGSAELVVPYHATPWLRSWGRRLLTWVSTHEVNLLFGWGMHYYQGPTVYPTDLARALPVSCSGFFYVTEMLVEALFAKYTCVEVGLRHQERSYGRSKAVGLTKILDAEREILQLWWDLRICRRPALSDSSASTVSALAIRKS